MQSKLVSTPVLLFGNVVDRPVLSLVVCLGRLFVRQVAKRKHRNKTRSTVGLRLGWLLRAETVLLAGVTLLTPLVTTEEWVVADAGGMGHPTTRFGPLFPLHLLHVIACWLVAIVCTFQEAYSKGTAPARKKHKS